MRSVVLGEGALDYLMLRRWGYPAVALMGTYASASVLETLRRWERLDELSTAPPAVQVVAAANPPDRAADG